MGTAQTAVIRQTNFEGLKLLSRGKVRDIYEVDDHRLLIVATDRLSAFDVVMNEGIPFKGNVLTQLSRFWFERYRNDFPNHFMSTRVEDFPEHLRGQASALEGRTMLVHRTRPLMIECVVRGYLTGSGWKDYQTTGSVCGIPLPKGLTDSARLDEPIFTPATKSTTGHDLNISFAEAAEIVGKAAAEIVRDRSIALYSRAREYAESRGILIADTKFEWGWLGNEIILIDEVLTPDSSRFWPKDGYAPGKSQPSFDKQFVRDYLESLKWNKQPPPPSLPPDVIGRTSEKYREAYRLLTGWELGSNVEPH